MTPSEKALIQRLADEAHLLPDEPHYHFASAEMMDAYYELRAKAYGFSSYKEMAATVSEYYEQLPEWMEEEDQKLQSRRAEALEMFLGPLLRKAPH